MPTNPLDKRKNNKGVVKYEQPKDVQITLRLTSKAKEWLKDNGGADLIEQLARGMKTLKDD